MPTVTSSSEARARWAQLLDEATQGREPIIITRQGRPDVALIAADELSSIMETLHLLSSPVNAARLVASIEAGRRGEGIPMTIEELKRAVGLDDEP